MKAIQRALLTVALLLSACPAFGIEGLQIAVECPDVVLSWPSVEGETYIVQYRPTLGTNAAWMTLTDGLPAAVGTNWTWFAHSNQVVCMTNAVSGGGSGSAPPSPMVAGLSAEGTSASAAFPIAETTREFLARWRVYPPYLWDLEGRPPHLWELEARAAVSVGAGRDQAEHERLPRRR